MLTNRLNKSASMQRKINKPRQNFPIPCEGLRRQGSERLMSRRRARSTAEAESDTICTFAAGPDHAALFSGGRALAQCRQATPSLCGYACVCFAGERCDTFSRVGENVGGRVTGQQQPKLSRETHAEI